MRDTSRLMAMAALALGSMAGVSVSAGPNWRRRRFPNGPGWTHAHVGRMARKRRHQKRNRRAHRG